MAMFDHERAHMAANLVSDPPVNCTHTARATASERAMVRAIRAFD